MSGFMCPGMIAPGVMDNVNFPFVPPPITQISSIVLQGTPTVSTGATITPPSNAAGDVIVLFDYAQQSGTPPNAATPSGWTQFVSNTGGTSRGSICYRVSPGSVGISTGMAASTTRKICAVFRPNLAPQTTTVIDPTMTYYTNAPSDTLSAGATTDADLWLSFMVQIELNAIPSRGWSGTPSMSGEANNGLFCYMGYGFSYNHAAQNVTINFSDQGTQMMGGGILRLTRTS